MQLLRNTYFKLAITKKPIFNLKAGAINVIYVFAFAANFAVAQTIADNKPSQVIPIPVLKSLEKNQIPLDKISISVIEVSKVNTEVSSQELIDWRSNLGMNPASTIKLLTTLTALDILGPQYRWITKVFTDGILNQGTLKGNIYLQGTGDPKLVPEELARMMKSLRDLGIQRIDGDLIFDRSAYSPSVMEHDTIDGESLRAYNVPPDPLLYAFRTLSFQLNAARSTELIDINYSPALAQFKVNNNLKLNRLPCEYWRKDIQFDLSAYAENTFQNTSSVNPSDNIQWQANFSGVFPLPCSGATYNIVAFDPNTFLTLGISAAWELSGGVWAQPPKGRSGPVPITARQLLEFQGVNLGSDVQDINKYSNNVMARQLFLTLALEKIGKPATTSNSEQVILAWLKQRKLNFPELVLENGSGLSRNETISALHMNELLVSARSLSISDVFYNSLPLAGKDGTMKNRLLTQLRKFLHLKKQPEARIKTGSLAEVRAISGYVMSKSGNLYAVTSFINHPNAYRGQDAHDQLLEWLLNDGPEPKHAR